MGRVIVHLDVDCFFVQVELLNHPELRGKPVAVYQHGDILAVSYEAKEKGVLKHQTPESVQEQFPDVTLLSVPLEEGTTKVSYIKVITKYYY
jgi:nucleotidyltransferase/DNA polymerase involved in DNA repair